MPDPAIGIDDDLQKQIDEEEAKTDPADDPTSNEGGELEMLKQLEGLDLQIQAQESDKAATLKVFNKKLKDLTKARNTLLKDIEAWRLGQRGLYDG